MIGVIVNPRAGYVAQGRLEQLRSLIGVAVPDAQVVVLEPHDDVHARCQELLAAGATCIAAVGGDGTVSSVAANLVDSQVPFGVIPGGTLNHFARDVGVGRDVRAAVETLAARHAVSVDVATVNDRLFLNNSSIGLYPEMVHLRETEEQQLGKVRALLRAGLLALRRTKWTTVQVSSGDYVGEVRTRLLFVGNNQYELRLLHLGRRASLQEGVLSCFVLDAPTRLHLVHTVLRSLEGRHTGHQYFRSMRVAEMTVVPDQELQVDVAADGEVFPMRTPLVYKIRPRALHVVVPQSTPPTRHDQG
jgi:diacylglycerol kinase family enzyme